VASGTQRKRQVLVVEDEAAIRELLQRTWRAAMGRLRGRALFKALPRFCHNQDVEWERREVPQAGSNRSRTPSRADHVDA
jgi:hypothetical protein